MKTDPEIKKDILDEFSWKPSLQDAHINVEVYEGHIILSGPVSSYTKKVEAEDASRKIAGVKTVSNDLVVNIPPASKRRDKEIKKAVLDAIKWNSSINEEKVKVEVKEGWVTLNGEVEWQYQRSKARLLAEDITGVTGVTNLITVVAISAIPSDVEDRIRSAMQRNTYLNPRNIHVEVNGSKAVLSGKVHNSAEKHAAEAAAWSAPGISEVINDIDVDQSEVLV